MEEMINRKNELLLEASKRLNEVGRVARMLEHVDFENVSAAKTFCDVVANYLRDQSYYAYTMRDEADKALPEAVEVSEDESNV